MILFFLALLLGIFVFLIWLVLALFPMIYGAPYVPNKKTNIDELKKLIVGRKKVADLGSGDGRVLVALAPENVELHGYEINPILVWQSRRKIRAAGFEKKIFIHWQNFWRVDFTSFDTVSIYGFPYIMKRLEEKLEKELQPGSMVITSGFHFPHWPPKEKNGELATYQVNSL